MKLKLPAAGEQLPFRELEQLGARFPGRPISRYPYSLRCVEDVYAVRGGVNGWHVGCRYCREWLWLPKAACRPGNEFFKYLLEHAGEHRRAMYASASAGAVQALSTPEGS